MNINNFIIAYGIYLPVVIGLTYYISKILFKNGKVFMLDIFNGREEIALATNRLFEVGFYLLNLGFALKILEINRHNLNAKDMVDILSGKIGGFSIYLGIVLFLNLFLFFRGKTKAKQMRMEAERLKMGVTAG